MLWYIIMGAMILAEAAVIFFVLNRAAAIIDEYEAKIGELENETVEEHRIIKPLNTLVSCKRVFEEEWA